MRDRMSASRLRQRLRLLQTELAAAHASGLAGDERYRRELEAELARCRTAFVEAAVIEIAVLRAVISGRLAG